MADVWEYVRSNPVVLMAALWVVTWPLARRRRRRQARERQASRAAVRHHVAAGWGRGIKEG